VRLWPGLAIGLFVTVSGCSGGTSPAARHGTTDHLELAKSKLVAGQSLTAVLVVDNPGDAINLTEVASEVVRREGQSPVTRLTGCRPEFEVVLTNGTAQQQPAFRADCSSAPYIINHGTTRLPFRLDTTYSSCLQPNGQSLQPTPRCIGPNSNTEPPLPPGKYKASVVWSETVPVPKPPPVTVTVVASG